MGLGGWNVGQIDYYYGRSGSGGGVPTTISLSATSKVFGDEFEVRDRVPNNRHEQPSVEFVDGETFLFSAFPWNVKFAGMGFMTWYDENNGHYPAMITTTDRADTFDNHLTSTGIHLGDYIYVERERDHHQELEMWRAHKDDKNFYLMDTLAPNNARAQLYPWNGNILCAYQEDQEVISVVIFNTTTNLWETPKQLVLPHQVGKRIYTSRPLGMYSDSSGFIYMLVQLSTSNGHEEYAVWKTDDLITFWNLAETESFVIPTSGDAVESDTVMATAGFKFFGRPNATPSLANVSTSLGDDGVFRALCFDDLDNTLYFITHNGSEFVSEEITLPDGHEVRPATITYNYTSINDNGGNSQIVIPGQDVSWDFPVGSEDWFTAAGAATEILATEFSGGDTLVTFDHTFAGTGTGEVRSAWPDGSSVFWMQHKNGVTYFTIWVQSGSYKKWFLFKKEGEVITTLGDVFEDVDENVHKCLAPTNVIPDNTNFVFYGCKFAYLGDQSAIVRGYLYAKVAAFGTVQAEVPNYPTDAYANRAAELSDIGWKMAYSFDDVTESGGSITQLNDQSGNDYHATASNAACYIEDGAIKTYGSGYFQLNSHAANLQQDDAFTIAVVARKIGDGWLLCGGRSADQYDDTGCRILSGGSVGHQIGFTNASENTTNAYDRIIGDEYAICIIWSDGKHLRARINGIEQNFSYSDSAPIDMVQWFKYYDDLGLSFDRFSIGAKVTTTAIERTPLDFKEWRYKAEAITYSELVQLENYWANAYLITLRSLGTVGTYEPESETTFARFAVEPSDADKIIMNDLIVKIKTELSLASGEHSLGQAFDKLYIRANVSKEGALLNFARTRFDGTDVNTTTFSQYVGVKSNGSTSYINNNFNPSLHSRFTNTNCGFFDVVVEDVARGNKASSGLVNSSRIFPRNGSDVASMVITATTAVTQANTNMVGFYGAYRRAGTTRVIRKNKTETTSVTAAQAFANSNTFSCAENNGSGTPQFYLDAFVAIHGWCKYDLRRGGDSTAWTQAWDDLVDACDEWLLDRGIDIGV